MSLNFVSIGGTTKFKFCGPEDVVPHNFTQFFHTNFCGTTFMFLLRSGLKTKTIYGCRCDERLKN